VVEAKGEDDKLVTSTFTADVWNVVCWTANTATLLEALDASEEDADPCRGLPLAMIELATTTADLVF